MSDKKRSSKLKKEVVEIVESEEDIDESEPPKPMRPKMKVPKLIKTVVEVEEIKEEPIRREVIISVPHKKIIKKIKPIREEDADVDEIVNFPTKELDVVVSEDKHIKSDRNSKFTVKNLKAYQRYVKRLTLLSKAIYTLTSKRKELSDLQQDKLEKFKDEVIQLEKLIDLLSEYKGLTEEDVRKSTKSTSSAGKRVDNIK